MKTAIALLILVSCHSASTGMASSVPADDASWAPIQPTVTQSCSDACTTLARVHCPMGNWPNCAGFLTSMTSTGDVANAVNNMPLTCAAIAAVTSLEGAKALGFGCIDTDGSISE
jgi:hypothetical protein